VNEIELDKPDPLPKKVKQQEEQPGIQGGHQVKVLLLAHK